MTAQGGLGSVLKFPEDGRFGQHQLRGPPGQACRGGRESVVVRHRRIIRDESKNHMKFHHLLHQREAALRQARLTTGAFAYHELGGFAARIARGQLRGEVTLHFADPAADRPWPVLLANEGSQSVIEEHFRDEDIVELADLIAFLTEGEGATTLTFRIEELEARFKGSLRRELEAAGVEIQ